MRRIYLLLSIVVLLLPATTFAQSASSNSNIDVLRDYIPCVLDIREQAALRGIREAVTADTATAIKESAKKQNEQLGEQGLLDREEVKKLDTAIEGLKLEGLRPADAVKAVARTPEKAGIAPGKKEVAGAMLQDSAQKLLPVGERPSDIGCSMSVLEWKEASDIFGRRVASEYIIVQVIVRNLSSDNEFLLHDVKVAVDTNGPGVYNKFQSGRDKLLARGVALRGQSADPRNVALRGLEGAGGIGAAVANIVDGQFAEGVNVFNAAFLPAFTHFFPDYTIDQINRLNDLAFSSSSSSKILVPRNGAVPMVTFIPEKPLRDVWFVYAKPCVNTVTGKPGPAVDNKTCDDPLHVARDVKPIKYRKWSPTALRLLQENTYVVLAGKHIQDVENVSDVKALVCPTGANALDLSKANGSTLQCTLNGSGLNLVAKVLLKSDNDTKVQGSTSIGSDESTATVTFQVADLQKLNGAYRVFKVDKKGTDTDIGQQVQLEKPSISSVTPSTALKADALEGKTLAVQGIHLDWVDSLDFVKEGDEKSSFSASLANASSNGQTATATISKPSGEVSLGTYAVSFHWAFGDKSTAFKTKATALAVGGTAKTPETTPPKAVKPKVKTAKP